MYQAYLVDGLQLRKDFDYNIVELISILIVKIKRWYKIAVILCQYKPVIITTNNAPGILYPNTLASLSERMMFVNCGGYNRFQFIERIRYIHGLPIFNEQIVQRMDQMFWLTFIWLLYYVYINIMQQNVILRDLT